AAVLGAVDAGAGDAFLRAAAGRRILREAARLVEQPDGRARRGPAVVTGALANQRRRSVAAGAGSARQHVLFSPAGAVPEAARCRPRPGQSGAGARISPPALWDDR